MLARLWWKEWRVFAPACLLLILGAAGVQWAYVANNGKEAQDGSTSMIALVWAVLYAYAAGAAAFAGERDGKTIGFLDALPVSRPMLWLGKASFALLSTLALAMALMIVAELGVGERNLGKYHLETVAGIFAIFVAEGLGWGLFWSSLLANPMAAGALAVTSAATVVIVANKFGDHSASADAGLNRARLIMAGLALAGSAVAMSGKRLPVRLPSLPRWDRGTASLAVARASVRRSLLWQTGREGWMGWLIALIVALALPATYVILGENGDASFVVGLASIACVMAGIGVFGQENVTGTKRFLRDQGVAPGSAWGWKMLAWGVGILALIAAVLVTMLLVPGWNPPPRMTKGSFVICHIAGWLDAFAVGVVCGMAGRRRITTGLVAVMALIALAPIQVVAATMEMVPPWTLFISPLILIAVSRAWAGDWLADRGGFRAYGRLTLLLVLPLGMQAVGYTAYRAWGEPDVGPLARPCPAQAAVVPPAEDAAEAYRQAATLIWDDPPASTGADYSVLIDEGWDPKRPAIKRWLNRQRPALEAARKASRMPRISAGDLPSRISGIGEDLLTPRLRNLSAWLALESRERQFDGDLPGAWDDILAQFRMADHLTAAWPTSGRMVSAAMLHHQAVGLAIAWAGDPKQAPASIRKALGDIRALPSRPTLVGSLRIDAVRNEALLSLPADELADILYSNISGNHTYGKTTGERLAFAFLVAPPWEREHARRVCRRIMAEQVQGVQREFWQREPSSINQFGELGPEYRGSPLTRFLLPATEMSVMPLDREVENRRALELFLAVRLWQLDHGGEYPETLGALVPTILDRLPIDPYSGRDFGYARSEGQDVWPAIRPDVYRSYQKPLATRPGQRLIYSVGPDGSDDHAANSFLTGLPNSWRGDLIVPLP